MHTKPWLLAGLLVLLGHMPDGAQAKPSDPDKDAAPPGTILNVSSLWRVRTVWETPEMILPEGDTTHGKVTIKDVYWWYNNPKGQMPPTNAPGSKTAVNYVVEKMERLRFPGETPADWMKPDFDDGGWPRMRAPVLERTVNEAWKAILMRGAFKVDDVEKAGDLKLALSFRGGAAVYLNGEEVGRYFMPAGPLDVYTLAEPYADRFFWDADGFAPLRPPKDIARQANCVIPAAKLKKGVNVLAVSIGRAATPSRFYASRPHEVGQPHTDEMWGKLGLANIALTASSTNAVVPNTSLVAGSGFRIWNQSIVQRAFMTDYPDPFSTLHPVQVSGARGGVYAAQVMVGDDRPIRGLAASVSDLKGAGTIPSSEIKVFYALPDGAGNFFDSLEEFPPAEVQVFKGGGAVQPIWMTVHVPPNTAPGTYKGEVAIRAEGVAAVTVPMILKVFDWQLPPYKEFSSRVDLVESPESVALAYNVPLWSDAHMKLLDRTFALMGPMSCKTLFITAIRRTHFGNEHAMLRWTRDDEGDLTPDFTVVEKYLDVATKHLGKIPGVILYCWEPPESAGHAGGAGTSGRTYDKPILLTQLNKSTGKLTARQGPSWGSPEAPIFWKKATDGMQALLAKRGMENSLLFGLLGDTRATKQAMDDISNGVPNAKWAVHSHLFCDNWNGYRSGFATALWGITEIVMRMDPKDGYGYGWASDFWLAYFPRGEIKLQSTPVEYRNKVEGWMGAVPRQNKRLGVMGVGRIGADFWPVVKDDRGRVIANLAGYFPEASWGQLTLNNTATYVLGRGKNGPIATVRSESLREGVQELEARIYLEKAWLDEEAKAMLGDELRGRIRALLDERIRVGLYLEGEGEPCFIGSDWAARAARLYELAGEVARKYNGKLPSPTLATPAKAAK